MHKYGIILYWSNEDGAFVAEVPELPGCMVHGDSQEDALERANEAMQLWIDTARGHGDPVPQPKAAAFVGDRIEQAGHLSPGP